MVSRQCPTYYPTSLDGRTVKPVGDPVTDKLPCPAAAVYLVSPAGW